MVALLSNKHNENAKTLPKSIIFDTGRIKKKHQEKEAWARAREVTPTNISEGDEAQPTTDLQHSKATIGDTSENKRNASGVRRRHGQGQGIPKGGTSQRPLLPNLWNIRMERDRKSRGKSRAD